MPLQEIMNPIGEIAKDTLNIIDININTAISLFLKILCNNPCVLLYILRPLHGIPKEYRILAIAYTADI